MSLDVQSMAFEIDRTRQPARIERARLVAEATAGEHVDAHHSFARFTHALGSLLSRAGAHLQESQPVEPVLADGGIR